MKIQATTKKKIKKYEQEAQLQRRTVYFTSGSI